MQLLRSSTYKLYKAILPFGIRPTSWPFFRDCFKQLWLGKKGRRSHNCWKPSEKCHGFLIVIIFTSLSYAYVMRHIICGIWRQKSMSGEQVNFALGKSQKQLWCLNNGELKATGDEFAFGTIRTNVELYLSEIFCFNGKIIV